MQKVPDVYLFFFSGVLMLNKGVYWDMKLREWPGIRSARSLVIAKVYVSTLPAMESIGG